MTTITAYSLGTALLRPTLRCFWRAGPRNQSARRLQNTLPTQPSSKSLQGIFIHDTSPVEVGFVNIHGFQPFIAPGTTLPIRKRIHLSCLFDHVNACDFELAYRYSPRDLHVSLGSAVLDRVKQGKGIDMPWYGTFEMDNTLHGIWTVRDSFTHCHSSLKFHLNLDLIEKGLLRST